MFKLHVRFQELKIFPDKLVEADHLRRVIILVQPFVHHVFYIVRELEGIGYNDLGIAYALIQLGEQRIIGRAGLCLLLDPLQPVPKHLRPRNNRR